MKRLLTFTCFCMVIVLLLTSCGGNKPSNKELETYLYNVYFLDASIKGKTQCVVPEWMESRGETNVWLVTYRFKGRDKDSRMLFVEMPDGSWQGALHGMNACPEE